MARSDLRCESHGSVLGNLPGLLRACRSRLALR